MLQAGFARVDVTPQLGTILTGYFSPRISDGILDPVELNALALRRGDETAVIITGDFMYMNEKDATRYRKLIERENGVPADHVLMQAVHQHTSTTGGECGPADATYNAFLARKYVDVVKMALDDLADATVSIAQKETSEPVAFVRRYRMKDGSVKTNPGYLNPDIDYPLGDADNTVRLVRFTREGKNDIALVNFQNHPDMIGGNKFSADWPGFLRRSFEKAVDNTRCIFFNGAQGDVNHFNVNDTTDLNGRLRAEFGPSGFARYIGRVVAGAVMQVYDRVEYQDVQNIRFCQKVIDAPSNMPRPEKMENARRIVALHEAGRDDLIPEEGMGITTVVSEALRMVRLEHGPESFPLLLSAAAIGSVALFGIPGEPFTGIGRGIKKTPGWDMVLPCGLVNAYWDYFPTMEAYEAGGYEARSSSYKAGVAELIVEEGKKLLALLK